MDIFLVVLVVLWAPMGAFSCAVWDATGAAEFKAVHNSRDDIGWYLFLIIGGPFFFIVAIINLMIFRHGLRFKWIEECFNASNQ